MGGEPWWEEHIYKSVVGVMVAMLQCRNVAMLQCCNVWLECERKGGDDFCRYAEMDKDAKNRISHRRRALDKVRKHFFDKEYAVPISLLSQRPDTS